MKRHSLIIALIFILPILGYTQSDNGIQQDTIRKSFGISTSFINNFLPLDNNVGLNSRYPFHYIKHYPNNRFRKQAFSIGIIGNLENNTGEDDVSLILLSPDYKFAWGSKRSVFEKGIVYYGPEVLFFPELNFRNTRSEFFENEVKDWTAELRLFAGPMVGLEYQLTPRLSLYTEVGAYLGVGYSYRQVSRVEEEEFDIDFIERNIIFDDLIRFPISIIVFYNF